MFTQSDLHRIFAQSDLYRIISAKVPHSPRYDGVLATPIAIQVGHLLAKKPLWYTGSDSEWESHVARIRSREDQEWSTREKALAEHYGVELKNELLDLDNPWRHLALRSRTGSHPRFPFSACELKFEIRTQGSCSKIER